MQNWILTCNLISTITADLQTKHPRASVFITGDFNHVSLSLLHPSLLRSVHPMYNKGHNLRSAAPKFMQFHCAPSIRQVRSHLGFALSSYKPVWQQWPTVRTVKKCSPESLCYPGRHSLGGFQPSTAGFLTMFLFP